MLHYRPVDREVPNVGWQIHNYRVLSHYEVILHFLDKKELAEEIAQFLKELEDPIADYDRSRNVKQFNQLFQAVWMGLAGQENGRFLSLFRHLGTESIASAIALSNFGCRGKMTFIDVLEKAIHMKNNELPDYGKAELCAETYLAKFLFDQVTPGRRVGQEVDASFARTRIDRTFRDSLVPRLGVDRTFKREVGFNDHIRVFTGSVRRLDSQECMFFGKDKTLSLVLFAQREGNKIIYEGYRDDSSGAGGVDMEPVKLSRRILLDTLESILARYFLNNNPIPYDRPYKPGDNDLVDRIELGEEDIDLRNGLPWFDLFHTDR